MQRVLGALTLHAGNSGPALPLTPPSPPRAFLCAALPMLRRYQHGGGPNTRAALRARRVLEDVKEIWTEVPKSGKGKSKAKPVRPHAPLHV